jgi:hypothetical protein
LYILLLLLSDDEEKKCIEQTRATFYIVRMGNLPDLFPNATPLVSKFFGEMSNKRQF